MTELAKIAYEGYAEHTNGKTFDGRPMPTWDELGQTEAGRRTQAAWEAGVTAVFRSMWADALEGRE